MKGSPPHVRGPRKFLKRLSGGIGITPACAGTTPLFPFFSSDCRDHPRMCGDHKVVEG